jgi:general secretion pathway protein N
MKRGRFWRWLGFFALSLVLFGVFLFVFAPADYFAHGVGLVSRGAVTVQQSSGTFWRGSGTLALARATAHDAAQPLGQVQWIIRPWQLFTGSIVVELQFAGHDTEARATVGVGLRHHTLDNVAIVAPVGYIAPFYPAAGLMGLSGRLRVTAATLEISKEALQGSAELLWEGAASRLLPIAPIGDYKLQVSSQGKRADLRLSTVQGVLQIAGQGEWRLFEDGTLRVQGTIAPSAPQPALEPFLNTFGPPQADGRRSFTFETRLMSLQPAALFPF